MTTEAVSVDSTTSILTDEEQFYPALTQQMSPEGLSPIIFAEAEAEAEAPSGSVVPENQEDQFYPAQSFPDHLIISESELPCEPSGIVEEVPASAEATGRPTISPAAAAILAQTRCVIVPFGWCRVFYSHADDGVDLTSKSKKTRGRKRKTPTSQAAISHAHSIYYVTPSGRVLLSADAAMDYLVDQQQTPHLFTCRCYLPVSSLAFEEVFNFEPTVGSLALTTKIDQTLEGSASRCLAWCAEVLHLEERLRTTAHYLRRREAKDPLAAIRLRARARAHILSVERKNCQDEEEYDGDQSNSGSSSGNDNHQEEVRRKKLEELTPEMVAMLTNASRRELLVTEDGQVFLRALTEEHLKHLTYELWQTGVNTELMPPFQKEVDSSEEEENEDFAAFFSGPVFGQQIPTKKSRQDQFETAIVKDEEQEEDSLIFLANQPTTEEGTGTCDQSKLDPSKPMMAASLSASGTVLLYDEPVPIAPDENDKVPAEKEKEKKVSSTSSRKRAHSAAVLQEEEEEEEEAIFENSSDDDGEIGSSFEMSYFPSSSDDDDDQQDIESSFLLSDVEGHSCFAQFSSDEEEEEAEAKDKSEKVTISKPPLDLDDLMTEDDSCSAGEPDSALPAPEELITEDEDEEEVSPVGKVHQQSPTITSTDRFRRMTRSLRAAAAVAAAETLQPSKPRVAKKRRLLLIPRELNKKVKREKKVEIKAFIPQKKKKPQQPKVKSEKKKKVKPGKNDIKALLASLPTTTSTSASARPSRRAASAAKESIRLTALNLY